MKPRIKVRVDPDFEDIIPVFLENRQADLRRMLDALQNADYDTIRVLGHGMKGFGKSYGFDYITEIGAHLEQSAHRKSSEEIKEFLNGLADYLERVDVNYE